MSKARLLLVVPDDDLSIGLFSADKRMDVKSAPYKSAPVAAENNWDFIYIRGPFIQSDYDDLEIKASINQILQKNKAAYVVDSIRDFSDLLLEDKWRQYQIFRRIMPHTELVDSFEGVRLSKKLIKKRISGRSRDIHFAVSELSSDAKPVDYVLQNRLVIRTEYRAFMLGGELILPLEIKSSKTERTRNKAIGTEDKAPEEVREICRRVYKELKFDLMGLDIAETEEGFYLLEANRSPQFVNYLKLSSKNLAEELSSYLLDKKT